jgi:hypothetical protein
VDTDAASYCVLRARPRAWAEAFWSAAREQDDVPPAIRDLLAGRDRVELTREAAVEALAWAAGIEGWEGAEPKPVFLYDPAAER